MLQSKSWDGFEGGVWQEEVNVRDFIQCNYTPYDGDESFLAPPTDATNRLWARVQELQKEERAKGGVLDMETEVVSGLTAYGPGYIDPALKDLEKVVGLQTDKPLKQAFMPYGGIRMAEEALENYGYKVSPKLHEVFTKYHKTHNAAVFDAYTEEIRAARRSHIITGLPDTHGRGRLVGGTPPPLAPPLFAQRHGQDEIEVFRRQPVRCVLAHQIRQRTAHAQIRQVFQLAYHAADGRFVIQRGPHSIKCGRIFLTTAAHRPARDMAETQRTALCRVDKIFRQIVYAASAKAV